MDDELDQIRESVDSNEAKNLLLLKKNKDLNLKNEVLRLENHELVKKVEDAGWLVTYFNGECNEHMLEIETLKKDNDSLKDQLTSIKKEKDDLKSVNTLLTKKLQEQEKDLSDFGKMVDDFIDTLKSEIKDMKLQNGKLKSETENLKLQNEKLKLELENVKLQNEKLKLELENVKLQNETSPSEVDKLMVLYRCSEKEKYIASMKLLEAEENIRKLRNELHSLQNFIASQNGTKRHKNEINEEKVQTSRLTDFDMSEVIDIAHFMSSIQDENSTQMNPGNKSEMSETSATQSDKKYKRLLEKETMSLTNNFCEEFEAKFEGKRSCLITKLTSCDDQIQALKELCVKLKREKLVLLDMMKEMDGIVSNYRKQVECSLAKVVEEADILRMTTRDFERKVKLLQ